MDKISMCFKTVMCILAFFSSGAQAQDKDIPLEVKFENSTTMEVPEGTMAVHFRCLVNRSPIYALNNYVDIIRVNPVNSDRSILSRGNVLEPAAHPEYYSIEMGQISDGNHFMLDFTINQVRHQDDGLFICTVYPKDKETTETVSAQRELIVQRPMSSLKIKLGDFDDFEQSTVGPIHLQNGMKYNVTCTAEGSNPATRDISLTLDDKPLMDDTDKPTIAAMNESVRMFKSEVAGSFYAKMSNTDQEIVCKAIDSTGQVKTIKVMIDPEGTSKDLPTLTCNDTEAYLGEKHVVLYCTVHYTGFKLERIAFEMPDGTFVEAGNENHSDNLEVTVSPVDDKVSVIALHIEQAEMKYLNQTYHAVVEAMSEEGDYRHNMTTIAMKECVRLIEVDNNDPGDGVIVTPVIGLFLLMCGIASLWSSHGI